MAEVLKNGIYVSFESIANGRDMPTFHYHDFYEIYYLYSGTRRYVVGNTVYDLKAGDIIIIDKNEVHITKNLGKNSGYQRFLLYVTADTLRSLGENSSVFERFFKNKVISPGQEDIIRINNIFKSMASNYDTSSIFSSQLLSNGVYELCTIIYSALRDESGGHKLFTGDIEKALMYIRQNYKSGISLNDVAEICNMNKSYFSRYFKKVTGIGFIRYLTALRIKEASMLLKNTDMSVSEVAENSGFESLQHFCSVFKNETGVSAMKYRTDSSVVTLMTSAEGTVCK